MSTNHNYRICKQYMQQNVRITTVQGITYEGTIVNVDHQNVYIQALRPTGRNKASISFFPFVLPLVLFDLLVIALLDSPRFGRGFW
ncbi:hypothetical protein [Paenibacillus sp. UNC451MF]|uniref:hypothetical protein n=1 Tax=Paenibacillus sp. UNC451MF TaxID=1449063 RepID=UPI00048DE314|nr:hypothetical protein [Paenibacillus sp. UNC451MF]